MLAAELVLSVLGLSALGLAGFGPLGAAAGAAPGERSRRAEPLLPDVRALPARDLYVTRTSTGRHLRFESALANLGKGPLEVRPNNRRVCTAEQRHASQAIYRDVDGNGRFNRRIDDKSFLRSAGCMIHHPTHDHWHFQAAAQYELLRPSRPDAIIRSRKASFCLRDSARVPPSWMTSPYDAYYGACSRTGWQGISIGWADVYQSFLPGQSLRLPRRVGDGVYCVRTTADARDRLREGNERNNVSIQAIRLRGDQVRVIDRSRCASVR